MSVHQAPAAFTSRRPVPIAAQSSPTDQRLFTAIALLVAVLIAAALLVLAAAPNLADLASLYVSTT